MDIATKNRGKLWKWARLVLDHEECRGVRILPLSSVGVDRQDLLLMRGDDPLLLLSSDDRRFVASCPTGEQASFSWPVGDVDLRTKDVLPSILSLVPTPPESPNPEAKSALDPACFGVLGHLAAATPRPVGTRAGDWCIGRLAVSPAGLARRADGELAVVVGGDDPAEDARLLEAFERGGAHPRRLTSARLEGLGAPEEPWVGQILSLADGSVVVSGKRVCRWTAQGGLRELPVSGEVRGHWAPRADAGWLLFADGSALSLVDGRLVRIPLPQGSKPVAARGAHVAWLDDQGEVWLSGPEALEPTSIVGRSRRLGPAPYDYDSPRSFHLTEDGKVLVYFGYRGSAVYELSGEPTDASEPRGWEAVFWSGYGYVTRYREHRPWVVVVKTHGVVLVDRSQGNRWHFAARRDYRFNRTSAAFAPSGEWLLVLGDETLYALTLADFALRRLIALPGVVELAEHPQGFLLMSDNSSMLLASAALDEVVKQAPVVERLVSDRDE